MKVLSSILKSLKTSKNHSNKTWLKSCNSKTDLPEEANSIFILQDAEMEEDQIHYMAILMSLWHWKLTSEQSKDLNRQNESSTSPLLHVQHVQKMAAYDNNNTTHCFDVSPLSSQYCYISPPVLNTVSLSLSTSLLLYSTHASCRLKKKVQW